MKKITYKVTTDKDLAINKSTNEAEIASAAVLLSEGSKTAKNDSNQEIKKEVATSSAFVELGNQEIRSEKQATEMKKTKKKKAKKSDINPKTGKKRFKKRYVIIPLILLLLLGIAYGGYQVYKTLQSYLVDVPELDMEKLKDFSAESEIYDRNGNLLTTYGGIENVDWVTFEECPQYLVDAFVSVEDERFYKHNGLDIRRFISAAINQLTKRNTHGGSTITQQLVSNVFLTKEVTYKRKFQEIYMSMNLEKQLTDELGDKEAAKNQILEYYMNHIYFGDLAYGVGAAASDYFDKDVKDLSLKEAALIAGVTNSPSYYNPRGCEVLDDECPAVVRANTVLYTMHNNKKISDEDYEKAINEQLVIAPRKYRELYPYPHLVEYTINNVAEKLLIKEGKETTSEAIAEKIDEIKNAGYKIYSTIDPRIQDIVQENVDTYENYPIARDGTLAEPQIAVIENHTGEVIAMCGSRIIPDDFDTFNRATMAYQPTGSTFKPLSVYAPCIEVGLGTGSVAKDTDEPIPGYNASGGVPGGVRFDRVCTMREALEFSHNVPAVRFLLEGCGIDNSMRFLTSMGFKKEELSPSPAGLALGASSVTVLEMTAAYQTFANDGVYIEPHGFTKIVDKHGNVILEANDETIDTHRVFSESTNWMTVDMLRTNMINGIGVNARLANMACAGKTGTHEWEVVAFGGFTPYYTSYIRITTDSYSYLVNSASYTQPTRLWKYYMTDIHEGLESKSLTSHDASELDIVRIAVCKESGMSPIEGCPTAYEYFLKGTFRGGVCPGHLSKEEECWNKGGNWNYENETCEIWEENWDQPSEQPQ